MRIDNARPRNRGWMWPVAAAIAALIPLIVWGSVSPAGAQPASTDPAPNSPEATHRVLLPLVLATRLPGQPTVFGVQMYSDLSSPSAALPLAVQGQVSWVRWPISWASIEPTNTTPAQYRFSGLDKAILAAYANGLHLIITVNGNPSWAATIANGRIDKVPISEFAQFTSALVERYDGDGLQDAPGSPIVDYWEFYNEPDGGSIASAEAGASYWGPFGADYAQMLCAVRPAMKAASARAQIVLGGIAYDWFTDQGGPFVRQFLDNVFAAGGGQCLDVMNFHYYPSFAPTWDPYGPGISGKANYLRSKLVSFGFGNLPMIATEAGWHSNNYPQFPSTPEIQAGYVVKFFAQSLASNLRVMIWWTWSDLEIAGAWWGDNGLLDRNLQPKLAYHAYRTAAGQLGNAAFQRMLSPAELAGANVQAYLFQHGGPLYVMWSNVEASQSVSLPGSSARVKDYVGSLVDEVTDGEDGHTDGRVHITVGSSPVYVEVVP